MTRLDAIRNFLQANVGTYYSVTEVCLSIGLPTGRAAHAIHTGFIQLTNQGQVAWRMGRCSHTSKQVRTYTWDPAAGAIAVAAGTHRTQPSAFIAPAAAAPAATAPKARRKRAPRAKPVVAAPTPAAPTPPPPQAAPTPPPPPPQAAPVPPPAPLLSPEQQLRAAARRAAAESAHRAREQQQAAAEQKDRLNRAKLTFRSLTGLMPTPGALDEAKRAFRKQALLLHPDRNGGKGDRFAELSAAWTEIERAYA